MHYRRATVRRLLGLLFCATLTLCLGLGQFSAIGQSSGTPQSDLAQSDPAQWVQMGVNRYQAGDYRGAIQFWQQALTAYQKPQQPDKVAIVLENLARAAQQLGQSDAALDYWQQMARLDRQSHNSAELSRVLTEQAQLYSQMGQPRKAIALLCGAEEPDKCAADSALRLALNSQAQSSQHSGQDAGQNSAILAAAWGSLGDAYRLLGEYQWALKSLESSLQQSQGKHPSLQIAALNSLGTVHLSLALINHRRADSADQSSDQGEAQELRQEGLTEDTLALENLQKSLQLAQTQQDGWGQVRSLLSAIPAYARMHRDSEAATAWQAADRLLTQLPETSDRVYRTIELARLLQLVGNPMNRNRSGSERQCLPDGTQTEALLQQANAVGQRIQNSRAQSFAFGELGHFYECRGQYARALDLTQKARLVAEQDLGSKDSLYLWEWQVGRILKAEGKETEAIAAYERSLNTLEPIRGDILTANREIQFDFRDTIEPIYRELVELKLKQEQPLPIAAKALPQEKPSKGFRSVLQTVDSLKLAELQNYFGNDCVGAIANLESVDLAARSAAAVFSTVIFDDRTAVIVSLPNGQQRFTWIPVTRQELVTQINTFRLSLEDSSKDFDDAKLALAQQVYGWLIRPFEADLQQSPVKTLVFVQDGIFRTVPMAALHDGQQFLIQKYAVANAPSLSLSNPKALNPKNLRALALGVSKAVQIGNRQFQSLANVGKELDGIQATLPGSRTLLDADFTRDRLSQELSQTVYPILHLATHGKFATDPKDTFIVTGDDQKLTLNDLDKLIRRVSRNTEPLELLSLIACETAVGNDRSALGLAGVAVQAGASSALASLWSVNDEATAQLSTQFYRQLRQGNVGKAEALQAVQKAMIARSNTAHPAYWAAFVLIGNWL